VSMHNQYIMVQKGETFVNPRLSRENNEPWGETLQEVEPIGHRLAHGPLRVMGT